MVITLILYSNNHLWIVLFFSRDKLKEFYLLLYSIVLRTLSISPLELYCIVIL